MIADDITFHPHIYEDTLINPRKDMLVTIRMVPFSEHHINYKITTHAPALDYLNRRFKNYVLTYSGTQAIDVALNTLKLNRHDTVSILTTTQNFYISGCVTQSIEKVCNWSREITEKTSAIYVNHEFGLPYPELAALKQYGLPIIEDCAYAFDSQNGDNSIGKIGDFCIYSFPKFFPVQIGGMLSYSDKYKVAPALTPEMETYCLRQLSPFIEEINQISEKRRKNFYLYEKLISSVPGASSYFKINEALSPGAFFFAHETADFPGLKQFLTSHGIESSVFYGKNAYFVPVHHLLTDDMILYIVKLIKYYVERHG